MWRGEELIEALHHNRPEHDQLESMVAYSGVRALLTDGLRRAGRAALSMVQRGRSFDFEPLDMVRLLEEVRIAHTFTKAGEPHVWEWTHPSFDKEVSKADYNDCTREAGSGKSGAIVQLCTKNKNHIRKTWLPQSATIKKGGTFEVRDNAYILPHVVNEFVINIMCMQWAIQNGMTREEMRENFAVTLKCKLIFKNDNGPQFESASIMLKSGYNYKGHSYVDLLKLFQTWAVPSKYDPACDAWFEKALSRYHNLYQQLWADIGFAHTDCKMANVFIYGKDDNLHMQISDLDKGCAMLNTPKGEYRVIPEPHVVEHYAILGDAGLSVTRYRMPKPKYPVIHDLMYLLGDIMLNAYFLLVSVPQRDDKVHLSDVAFSTHRKRGIGDYWMRKEVNATDMWTKVVAYFQETFATYAKKGNSTGWKTTVPKFTFSRLIMWQKQVKGIGAAIIKVDPPYDLLPQIQYVVKNCTLFSGLYDIEGLGDWTRRVESALVNVQS